MLASSSGLVCGSIPKIDTEIGSAHDRRSKESWASCFDEKESAYGAPMSDMHAAPRPLSSETRAQLPARLSAQAVVFIPNKDPAFLHYIRGPRARIEHVVAIAARGSDWRLWRRRWQPERTVVGYWRMGEAIVPLNKQI